MDFTKQEKQVLIFLVLTAAIGTGIVCYKNLTCQPKIEVTSSQQIRHKAIEKEARDYKVININTATRDDFIRLRKGIGPVLADAIIEYRSSHGNFVVKEDIKNVKGIGPSKYNAIKDHIRTE